MKPTISIYKDEIVIATDNFDLILKYTPPTTSSDNDCDEDCNECTFDDDVFPETLTEQQNWGETDPGKKVPENIRKFIKKQHPEYTDQRVVNVPVEKAVVYTPAEIAPAKHTRNLPAKPCKICGNDFKPTWNTQHYCPACKPKYYGQKRKPLAEQTAEELEKTLKEIENRRKKPYEFK